MVIFIVTTCGKQQHFPNRTKEGTQFNSDFARGYASHGLGATSLTVKKGDNKKLPLET